MEGRATGQFLFWGAVFAVLLIAHFAAIETELG